MSPKHQRLLFTLFGLALLVAASLLIMNRFRDNLVFFYSPTELAANTPLPDQYIRIGGLVEAGSVQQDGQHYEFVVTDTANELTVVYEGIPPALFREGQGVVAEGYYRGEQFAAEKLLAKHDENYMPPEVSDALKKQGAWQHAPENPPEGMQP